MSNKIKFANSTEYFLVPSGYNINNTTANFIIKADNLDLADVETVISIAENTKRIEIIDTSIVEPIHIIKGFDQLLDLKKEFSFHFVDEVVDPETEETVLTDITCDIISFTLSTATVEKRVDKNRADIEYIAIMSDIELE